MGLDAVVYCNCVETHKLRTPHPFPDLLFIDNAGCPQIRSKNSKKQIAHDEWLAESPCKHEECVFASEYLGNISRVAELRATLHKWAADAENSFPILLSQVIYSGSHCGDFLSLEVVRELQSEIETLHSLVSSKGNLEGDFRNFLEQIDDLIKAASQVGKPIAF